MPENEKGVLWVLTVSDNSLAELIDIIDALSQKKFNNFFALFCTSWTEMDNGAPAFQQLWRRASRNFENARVKPNHATLTATYTKRALRRLAYEQRGGVVCPVYAGDGARHGPYARFFWRRLSLGQFPGIVLQPGTTVFVLKNYW